MEVPQPHTSDLRQSDLSNDFDKLVDSPEGADIINRIFEGERARTNTMSLAEFKQYEALFQYNGMDLIGEAQFKDLAERYFGAISIYDPVKVMDGTTTVMILPPIFHRFNQIGMAGPTGTDINQAFINACMSDDPMVQNRLNKYAEFYKRMISIVNSDETHEEKKREAEQQAIAAMKAAASKKYESKNSSEIEDIPVSNFKDAEVESLFDSNATSTPGDEDEFEPL